MNDNYNYPWGADNSQAPWNQEELPYETLEVEVSAIIKKKCKIEVNDYERSEDGYDFSETDLQGAVKDQVDFPKDWEVSDIEVEL